jgi:hypothetical protein
MSASFLAIKDSSTQLKSGTLVMGTNLKESGVRVWKWVGGPDGVVDGTWEWFFDPTQTRANQLSNWAALLSRDNPGTGQAEIYASLEGHWTGPGTAGVPHIPWFSGTGDGAIVAFSSFAFKHSAIGFVFNWKPK